MNITISQSNQYFKNVSLEYSNKAKLKSGFKGLDFNNITKITEKSEAYFQQLRNLEKSLSLKERVKVYKEMSSGLQELAKYIYKSKNLWEKFLSLFIYLNSDEKAFGKVKSKINRHLRKVKNEEKKLWIGEGLMNNALNAIGFGLERIVTDNLTGGGKSPQFKLKMAAFQTLGGHRLESNLINGMNPFNANEELDKVIDNFVRDAGNTLCESDKKELAKIQNVLRNSRDHLEKLYLAKALTSDRNVVNFQSRLGDLAFVIKEQIERLKPGDSIAIHGGYGYKNRGHAVIYDIERKPNGTYRFTIVNTGQGVGQFSSLFSNLYSFIIKQFNDYYIDELSVDVVTNQELWKKLLNINISDHSSIEEMYSIIVEYLAKNKISKLQEGRRHWVQTNGTCAYDSLLCYMESKMDPLLFQMFHIYSTQNGLRQFNDQDVTYAATGLQAVVDGNSYQGRELILKLKACGKDTLQERMNDYSKRYDAEKEEARGMKEKLDKLKIELKKNETKFVKWKARENPGQYLEDQKKIVDSMLQLYCVASKQGLDTYKAPSFLSKIFSVTDPQVSKTWEDFQKEGKRLSKMKQKFKEAGYQEKVKSKVLEKQEFLRKASTEKDIQTSVLDDFNTRLSGADKFYRSLL